MTHELRVFSNGKWVSVSGGTGDDTIAVHEGQIPQPAGPIPQALEDAFADYADGLHFFKEVGTLVSVTRQEFQTTIVTSGASRSVAKVVKSAAGLPTPQNPSMLVQQSEDGKWMKLISDELNKPFGPPQIVDIFALTGGGTVDLTNYYTKPEVDNLLDGKIGRGEFDTNNSYFASLHNEVDRKLDLLNTGFSYYVLKTDAYTKTEIDAKLETINAGAGASIDIVSENLSNGLIRVAALETGKADKADTYTKTEIDDRFESEKDFSIANDNVLLASITSLQEIVSNLGEVGTGQMDVLAAIKGVEIEPSSIKLTGDAASPIAWKGGLSLAPVKVGNDWHLGWTDGKNTHQLVTSSEFTQANILEVLKGTDLEVSMVNAANGVVTFGSDFALGRDGSRLVAQAEGGLVEQIAYLSDIAGQDLSSYALLNDTAQAITAKSVTAETVQAAGVQFLIQGAPNTGLLRTDVGGQERLVYAVGNKKFPVAFTTELDQYVKKVDKDQNIVANGMVAKGYTFGDAISGSNPGLVYTDLNEGYGPRLVFDTQSGPEYLIYGSDLSAVKSRMDAMESKGAPAVDLSTTASKESFDLLQGQVQTIFDSVYTREEADARYAAKAAYVTTTAMNAVTSLMATRTYVDGAIDFQAKRLDATITETGVLAGEITALKAAAPTAAANINDPALAAFKQSVLDEVKKLMAGGKTIPADVPWTKLLNTGSTVAEAKVLNGVVYLRGVVTKSIAAGYVANAFQLPATIPPPPAEMVIPLACKNTSPAGRYYGYATVQVNRQIGVSCDNALNTVWLDGISYPAYD